MPYQFDKSYALEYGSVGQVKCNAKNRDILVAKLIELENIIKTNKALNNVENNTCPICMEPITNGIVVLKCEHKLCPNCYACHARVNNTCPMCRDEFAEKPKTTDPMPDQIRDDIVNTLFQNTPGGKNEYFTRVATSIKMKSLDEAVKTLTYLTTENCKLTCIGVIKWYDANHP